MKRSGCLVAAATLVLASSAAMPVSAAPVEPVSTVDITFDGHCDGLRLNIPSAGDTGRPETVDGIQIGCARGGVFGQARPDRQGRFGVTHGKEYLTLPSFSAFTVIESNHTWVHYGFDGDLITVLQSGTWSLGTPRSAAGAVSSLTGGAGTAGAAPVLIAAERDVSFDGYCDGMHLVAPSAGLGTARTVDGHRTGCSSDVLIGARGIVGTSPAYVVQFLAGTWVQTSLFSNHTWVHYVANGEKIRILNSGTWSDGPPVGETARPSTG